MSRVCKACISVDALKHNFSLAREAAAGSKLLAVIKANAYGHGMLTVADALQNADAFAVAHLEEAQVLRERYPQKSIVLLQGFVDEKELEILCALSLTPVVHSMYQIALLESIRLPDNFAVWLKVDTGMGRLGIGPDECGRVWERLNHIPQLQGQVRLMSHFANADNPGDTRTDVQIDCFNALAAPSFAERSLANSAGIMAWPQSHYQWIRPGIMLYGVSPFKEKTGLDLGLKPVMTLQGNIIAINAIKKNQTVGYGSCWQADEDTQIAVVACGYGDGYPRHIAEQTPVLIQRKRYPIVGRVSMDMLCVNLGNAHSVQVGDTVTLWGEGLPVETIAEQAGSIAYELLCQVTSRVNFIKQNSEHG